MKILVNSGNRKILIFLKLKLFLGLKLYFSNGNNDEIKNVDIFQNHNLFHSSLYYF